MLAVTAPTVPAVSGTTCSPKVSPAACIGSNRSCTPLGLQARPARRGLPKDQGERSVIAGNVLDRQFTADRPNQKWVADFTYICAAEGWLYLAVIDLYSRRVVGWSMSDTMTT